MAPMGITTMVTVSFMMLFSHPSLGTVTKLKYRSEMQLQRDRFYWQDKEGNVQLKCAVHLLLYLATLASESWWDFVAGKEDELRSCLVVSLSYKAFFLTLKRCGFSLCLLNGSNKSKDRQFEFFFV